MMKKISIALCLLLLASAAFAGIQSVEGYGSMASFYQFSHDEATNTGDYHDVQSAPQNWLAAQKISLTICEKCDLWVSHSVRSWCDPKPLVPLDGNIFDMSATNYGAFALNSDKVWVGDGSTTTVTYTDGAGHTNSTEAYYVGEVEAGDVIALWMTTLPTDGGEQVDMQQLVAPENGTTLVSRLDKTHDLAGNVRINFGINSTTVGFIGREFVAFGASEPKAGGPSGQPLPGAMATCLLAMGAVAAAKKMKKRA